MGRYVRSFDHYTARAGRPGFVQRFPKWDDPWWATNGYPAPDLTCEYEAASVVRWLGAGGANFIGVEGDANFVYRRVARGVLEHDSRDWDRPGFLMKPGLASMAFADGGFDFSGSYAMALILNVGRGVELLFPFLGMDNPGSGSTGIVFRVSDSATACVFYQNGGNKTISSVFVPRDRLCLFGFGWNATTKRAWMGVHGQAQEWTTTFGAASMDGGNGAFFPLSLGGRTQNMMFHWGGFWSGDDAETIGENWDAFDGDFFTHGRINDLTVDCDAQVIVSSPSGVGACGAGPDEPRLENAGLFVHPAYTNLALYANDLTNATWTKSGATATDRAAEGPSGQHDAIRLKESALEEPHNVSQSIVLNASSTYAVSCFAKANGRYLAISISIGTPAFAVFDLENGEVVNRDGFEDVPTNGGAYIRDCGNGWYKCVLIFETSLGDAGATSILWQLTNSANWTLEGSPYAGDGSSGVYLNLLNVCESDFEVPSVWSWDAAVSVPASKYEFSDPKTLRKINNGRYVLEFDFDHVSTESNVAITAYQGAAAYVVHAVVFVGGLHTLALAVDGDTWACSSPAILTPGNTYRARWWVYPDGTVRAMLYDVTNKLKLIDETGSITFSGLTSASKLYLGGDPDNLNQTPTIVRNVKVW